MFMYFQISLNIVHRIKWNTSSSLTTNPHTTVAFNQDQVETWCNLTEMFGSGAKWHQTVILDVLTCTCNLFASLVWREFFEKNWHPIKRRLLRARWCVWTFANQYGLWLPLGGEHWNHLTGWNWNLLTHATFSWAFQNIAGSVKMTTVLFSSDIKWGTSPNWSAAPWKFSSLEFSGISIGITPWTSVWPELGRSGFYPGSNLFIQILELLIHCEFLDPLFLLKSEKEPIWMTKPCCRNHGFFACFFLMKPQFQFLGDMQRGIMWKCVSENELHKFGHRNLGSCWEDSIICSITNAGGIH